MDIWFIGGLILGYVFIGGYVSGIVSDVTGAVGMATYPVRRSNRVRYIQSKRVRYYR